jgi:hypothetical protein
MCSGLIDCQLRSNAKYLQVLIFYLPLQSQTVSKSKTLTILVQIEYGKFSKKRIRHKDFPGDM